MIRIDALHLQAGSFALRELYLDIAAGEYFVLLGPTGAGKTLLVECLCGLRRVSSGSIRIAENDVTNLEPRHRGIGYLPQDYALFPHRTVAGNIAYGLESRRLDRATVERRVNDLLEQMGLADLRHRRPGNLSGGEQQRVALARALAVEPAVLLLDEPVSAVDESTRDSLCATLRRLQRQTGATTLHVCHSFQEMLAVADRVGILADGQLLQVGSPQDVLERPASLEVAEFVGARNILSARATAAGSGVRLSCRSGLELVAESSSDEPPSGDVFAVIRPESVRLLRPSLSAGASTFPASVCDIVQRGPLVEVRIASERGVELVASLARREFEDLGTALGATVEATIAPEHVHVLPR